MEWLTSYVQSPSTASLTFLIISHDSDFLDASCTDIIRFHNMQLTPYVGNYTAYLVIKEEKNLGLQVSPFISYRFKVI